MNKELQDAIEWVAFLKEIEAEEAEQKWKTEWKKYEEDEAKKLNANVIQFPTKLRQQQVETRKFCWDCEWKGRIIALDSNGNSWSFRCSCPMGAPFTSFPIYNPNLGLKNPMAAG